MLIMKKLTAIFLCFAMALSLAACGNTTSSTNESSTPESSVPPASGEASDTSSTAASQEPAFQGETEVEAGNTLVVYFSATGNTEQAATYIADITGDDLVSSIKQVHEGYAVFSPKLAGFVLSAFQNGPSANGAFGGPIHDDELDRLSNREQEVMRLIARGYTYKEVASELFISIKTVETHMSSVLRKLQLSNRSELTRWAADRRIV